MTLDEALSEAVAGARMTAAHMQPGCYIEHSFSRGFLRCWPVENVEDEPQRTQCDFNASELDTAATDWHELERPKTDSWGKPIGLAFFKALDEERNAPAVEVKPQRSKWGKTTPEAAIIAIEQKRAKAEPPATEFCGVCDFEKSKCKCDPEPKPTSSGWGNPLLKKETNKWGK